MAALSNTVYLESFIESVGFLPPELIRILNLMKSLDDRCEEIGERLRRRPEDWLDDSRGGSRRNSPETPSIEELSNFMDKHHNMLLHFAEEKHRLAQQAYELLQVHYLQLHADMCLLKQELKEQGGNAMLEGNEDVYNHQQDLRRQPARNRDRKPQHGLRIQDLPLLNAKGRRDRGNPGRTTSNFSEPHTPQHSGFSQQLSGQLSGHIAGHISQQLSGHLSSQLGDGIGSELGMVDSLYGGANDGRLDLPISEEVLFQVKPPPGMNHAAKVPQAPGRLLTPEDINPALQGRKAELFWPDDNLWYLIQIHRVDVTARSAQIIYTTGETEILNLDEIVQEGHMSLIE